MLKCKESQKFYLPILSMKILKRYPQNLAKLKKFSLSALSTQANGQNPFYAFGSIFISVLFISVKYGFANVCILPDLNTQPFFLAL
jgi:hypothetical protein